MSEFEPEGPSRLEVWAPVVSVVLFALTLWLLNGWLT